MTDLAFKAAYSDWKLIKTRGVVQVVMEIPLADADAAYNVLGGMPDAARENWFAVAPLKLPPAAKESNQPSHVSTPAKPRPDAAPAGAKRDWKDLQPAQQAGIRCAEPIFIAYLKETYPEDWRALEEDAAEVVRFVCGVNSRSQLNTNQTSRMIWHQLDEGYQAWKAMEHA